MTSIVSSVFTSNFLSMSPRVASSTAVVIVCVAGLLSSNAHAASDAEQFGRCKRAVQSEYGESTRVKLVRVKRYKGAVTVKLRVQSDATNEGARFVSICTIDRAGALEIAPRG